MKNIVGAIACACLAATLGVARAEDAKGCKDPPFLSRMPGSVIAFCRNEEFGSFAGNLLRYGKSRRKARIGRRAG